MFSRIFNYSIKNIFRNKFLSISSILVLTLLVFFINLLLVIQNISFKLIDTVNEKMTVSLYLEEEYDKNSEPVTLLINSIEDLGEGIEVNYKTKLDVLEEIRQKDPELVRILERTNPLPETIELSNIEIESWEKVNSIIEGKIFLFSKEENSDLNKGKKHFSEYSSQYKKIEGITRYLSILKNALYIMVILFFLSIGVIIYSIIGNFVFYYKDEIYITRLVGGSNIFIYGPFSIQGMIYAFTSLLTGIGVFYLGVILVNLRLNESFNFSYLLGEKYLLLFLLEALILVLIGGISGLISSRKYLK